MYRYLWLVEYWSDGIRYMYNLSRLTLSDKQESISRLQYEVLQLVIGEEGRLIATV